MKALFRKCSKAQLNCCIRLNFEKNVPFKASWLAGGFSSLKLTAGFYESDTADRIFRKIFGIKQCRIELWALAEGEIESLSSTVFFEKADTPNKDSIVDLPDKNTSKVKYNHWSWFDVRCSPPFQPNNRSRIKCKKFLCLKRCRHRI